MEKKLLIDNFGTIRLSLHESADGKGKLVARGEFGRADIPTENKRIYPRKVWEREIGKIIESMHAGQVLGELDHPADGKTKLTRASHIMTNLEIQDDGTIVGEATIMDTPNGEILKKLVGSGAAVGISSRGYGSTSRNEDGYEVVQEDYTYLTHDFVADPAVRTAIPKFTEEGKGAKGESKIMETKDQKQPVKTESAGSAPAKTYSEEELQQRLKEHEDKLSEKFAQQMIAKIAEVKDSVTEDIRNQLMSDPSVAGARTALEQVKEILRPFILPEDSNAVVRAKDEEIATLKAQLADKAKEVAAVESKALQIGESAKNLTLKFALNDLLATFEHRKEAESMIGPVTGYKTMESLSETVEKVKAAIVKQKEEEKAKADEAKRVEEKHNKELADLKAQLESTQKTAKEAIEMARKYQISLYVESRIRNNPNAAKLKKLCEGAETKEKVDEIVSSFSVDRNVDSGYNLVRNQLAERKRLQERARAANLVESHVEETTRAHKPSGDGVDAELESLGQMDL